MLNKDIFVLKTSLAVVNIFWTKYIISVKWTNDCEQQIEETGFKVLFQHFHETGKKSHETVQGQPPCRIIFKLRTSKIWITMKTTAVPLWFYNLLHYSTAIIALKRHWSRVTCSPGCLLSRWLTCLYFLPLDALVCNLTAASFDCTLRHIKVKWISGHIWLHSSVVHWYCYDTEEQCVC